MKKIIFLFFFIFSFSSYSITISMKNVDINIFIDKVSVLTGKNFIVAPNVSGTVNLQINSDIDINSFYSLFLATLKLHKLIALNDNLGFVKIMPFDEVKRYSLPALTEIVYLNYSNSDVLISDLKLFDFLDNDDLVNRSLLSNVFTNSIVITGSRNYLNHVRNLITLLDVRKKQVLIEAVILEVGTSFLKDLGVDWLVKGSDGVGILNFSDLISALSGSSIVGGSLGITTGGFKVVLNALNSMGFANILSTPSVVTVDGSEAYIVVGQEVPFLVSSDVSDSSDLKSRQRYVRKDVGLKLTVTPKIGKNGDIFLKINQEMSYILPSVSASDLITSKRQIKTNVMINDGQLLILGGLIDDNTKNNKSSVPFLSSIPLFGALFSSQKITKEKRNLLLFLKPTILSNEINSNIVNKFVSKIPSLLKSTPVKKMPVVKTPVKKDRVKNMPVKKMPVKVIPKTPVKNWN